MWWTLLLLVALVAVLYCVWRRSIRKHHLCAPFAVRAWVHPHAKKEFGSLVKQFGFPSMHNDKLAMWTDAAPYSEILVRDEPTPCVYGTLDIRNVPDAKHDAMRQLSESIALDPVRKALSVREHTMPAIDAIMTCAMHAAHGREVPDVEAQKQRAMAEQSYGTHLRQQLATLTQLPALTQQVPTLAVPTGNDQAV